MLVIVGNFMFSGFGLIVSSWMLAVLVLLIAGLATLLFFKFRTKNSDVGRTISRSDTRSLTRHGVPVKEMVRPVRREATPVKEVEPSEKNTQESININDLPISQISGLSMPYPIENLPMSDDEGLLAAIEEIQDDSDADSEFRAVALRVLANFKTRNSIEALSQIALYDLSTNLRAKAVAMLANFDHQSVFETIVLSCADPSREVRAAGARALVKVTFDRGDEWARIALADDKYLSRQIAKAAVEAGLAERSFDRLTLRDERAAYEAFALVYLIVIAGEIEKVFDAIRGHRDMKVRVALLHIVKAANAAEVIPRLSAFIASEPISSPLADKARETLLGITAVSVDA